MWYNCDMEKKNLGTGPTLREANPWLQDDAIRRERILDVTERNSVIEGLPPLQEETRLLIIQRMQAVLAATAKPAE